MKYIAEILFIIALSSVFSTNFRAGREAYDTCAELDGDKMVDVNEGLSRLERIMAYVLVLPGAKLGCYLGEKDEES